MFRSVEPDISRVGENRTLPLKACSEPRPLSNSLPVFSDVGYQGNFLFSVGGPPVLTVGHAVVRHLGLAAISIHAVTFPLQLPEANSLWQAAAGSDQPPVILFLHMASSVKHPLHIPARAPRGTCDWLACCRHSCQGSPSVLINAIDLPKSCLPRQLGALLAQPTANWCDTVRKHQFCASSVDIWQYCQIYSVSELFFLWVF